MKTSEKKAEGLMFYKKLFKSLAFVNFLLADLHVLLISRPNSTRADVKLR